MPHISAVIPVYKCADSLVELKTRLVESLETVSSDFEILFVEDCGNDASWPLILEFAATDPRIRGLQFSRNFGQHYGITAGLDHCDGDWVVVMDGDLQDLPEDIPALYRKAIEGFDVVLAVRASREDRFLKKLGSSLFYRAFSYLTDGAFKSNVGNFRIMSREVVTSFRQLRERLRFFVCLVDWLGFSIAEVELSRAKRLTGKSTYTFAKLWRLATDAAVNYSDKPLRLAVRLGFLMAAIGFSVGLNLFYGALVHGYDVMGWASVIVSLYFIGGIIISLLGVIGIYLGKTFDEVKHRPLYVVRNSANLNLKKS